MEGKWNYQLSVEGAIIKVPTDNRPFQRSRETGYYNHLTTALESLLKLNRWNRLIHSANISVEQTGEPLVSLLNLAEADNNSNPFLDPGLYLSFDVGIARFEKLAGISLKPLEQINGFTAMLGAYQTDGRPILVTSPGLVDLQAAITQKRNQEALELYRLWLTGRPEASTYHQTSYHYHDLKGSLSALLSTNLARLAPGPGDVSGKEHAIGMATLQYGESSYPVASLVREDQSKDAQVPPGAYLFTSSDLFELQRHSGVDLSGLPVHKDGNLTFLKLADISQDGSSLPPSPALQKIRSELLPAGQPGFAFRYHYPPVKGGPEIGGPAVNYRDRTFQTLYTAMQHFLSTSKDILGKPYLDDRPISSIELIDLREQRTIGHLFSQKKATGGRTAGYHLQVDPDYLKKVYHQTDTPLKTAQRDKDLHILLSPFEGKAPVKTYTSKAGRSKPPPANGKSKSR